MQVNSNDNLATISSIGLLLGVIHVLTGADHLSAISLITLNKNMRESFFAGITWGAGHCIGLSVIAAIFFGLDYKYNFLENEMSVADKIVGFFMTSLGCYGFYSTRKIYLSIIDNKKINENGAIQHANQEMIHEDGNRDDKNIGDEIVNTDAVVIIDSEYLNDIEVCVHDHEHHHEEESVVVVHSHEHTHYFVNKMKNATCYSVLIGIVHGISGTGAVLGILPAITLHDSKKTSVYLISFFLSSLVTMGIYAITWNRINSFVKDKSKINLYNFYSQFVMSTITLGVGILWLSVSFTVGLDYYGL